MATRISTDIIRAPVNAPSSAESVFSMLASRFFQAQNTRMGEIKQLVDCTETFDVTTAERIFSLYESISANFKAQYETQNITLVEQQALIDVLRKQLSPLTLQDAPTIELPSDPSLERETLNHSILDYNQCKYNPDPSNSIHTVAYRLIQSYDVICSAFTEYGLAQKAAYEKQESYIKLLQKILTEGK